MPQTLLDFRDEVLQAHLSEIAISGGALLLPGGTTRQIHVNFYAPTHEHVGHVSVDFITLLPPRRPNDLSVLPEWIVQPDGYLTHKDYTRCGDWQWRGEVSISNQHYRPSEIGDFMPYVNRMVRLAAAFETWLKAHANKV